MRRALLPVVLAATAWTSVLAGAAWIHVFVDQPARHRLDDVVYAEYARAANLGPGRVVYPLLGGGGLVLTAAAVALALWTRAPRRVTGPLVIAVCCALAGLLVNLRAVAAMQAIGRTPDRAAAVAPLLTRFAVWSDVRTVFVELTFWCVLAALVAGARARDAAVRVPLDSDAGLP
jgi:hypothetical protein